MGTSWGVVGNRGCRDVLSGKVIKTGESAVFSPADLGPALEPLALPSALHLVLADQTAAAIEPGVAVAGAEGVVIVLDRLRQLPAAMRVAAAVTKERVHCWGLCQLEQKRLRPVECAWLR